MSAQQVAWHIKGKIEDVKDRWRMTRRLCYYTLGSFRKFNGTEVSLWKIDEDETEQVTSRKIELWKHRLKELGK